MGGFFSSIKREKNKYNKLFNSVDQGNSHACLINRPDFCDLITISDVSNMCKRLSINKAVGVDDIPGEIYYYSSHRMHILLAIFINACLRHNFIPQIIIKTVLIPILNKALGESIPPPTAFG